MKLNNLVLISVMTLSIQNGCAWEYDDDWFAARRLKMVQTQLKGRDITDQKVLSIMSKVPRHEFVPLISITAAYGDYPLSIGYGQTISQPYIVAYMTQELHLKGSERVLEIGTGSGYQAAVLAETCAQVYSIEIVPQLAASSAEKLRELGYENVTVKEGDGYKGWPEYAPFDAIIVTAAPPKVPKALLDQLKIGGRLIVPEGDYFQVLRLYTRTAKGIEMENLIPVRFVPMIHGK